MSKELEHIFSIYFGNIWRPFESVLIPDIKRLIKTQVEAERERCAKICEDSCFENECASWGICQCSSDKLAQKIRKNPTSSI